MIIVKQKLINKIVIDYRINPINYLYIILLKIQKLDF